MIPIRSRATRPLPSVGADSPVLRRTRIRFLSQDFRRSGEAKPRYPVGEEKEAGEGTGEGRKYSSLRAEQAAVRPPLRSGLARRGRPPPEKAFKPFRKEYR